MDITARVKGILTNPAAEWNVIAGEQTDAQSLITGYVLPLASIAALAGFIGGSLVGQTLPFVGTYRVPLLTGIGAAVFAVVMAAVGVFVMSLIINALAPTFGAEKNSTQALKVAAYSYTPAWVAGVFQILPALFILVVLGGLYGLYILYLGLPRLMKCPADKAAGYTAVVVVCAIVLTIVIGAAGGIVIGAGAAGAGLLTGGGGSSERAASESVFDPDSLLGRIERGVEQSARKMEDAERAGDQGAQVAAAMEGIGAVLGGGARVEPIDVAEIRGLVPESFAGMPRLSSSAEKTAFGISVSRAEATYGEAGRPRQVTLEMVDSGGMSGLMGLVGWMGVQGERESDDGYERTRRENGRLVHEKVSRAAGTSEYAIVGGDRFLVTATGRDVGIDEIKTAVASLELGRLEALGVAGGQR